MNYTTQCTDCARLLRAHEEHHDFGDTVCQRCFIDRHCRVFEAESLWKTIGWTILIGVVFAVGTILMML